MPTKIIKKHGPRIVQCWKAQCPPEVSKPCWLAKRRVQKGLDINGFFLSEIGLGESARLYFLAAKSSNFAVNAINRPLKGRQNAEDLIDAISDYPRYLCSLSVAGLKSFKGLSRALCKQRYNIALPYWELNTLSKKRVGHLEAFDEVWAPSSFIKQNLEQHLAGKPILLKQPVAIPGNSVIPDKSCRPLRILFFFDFDSFSARKNPEAAVRAFQTAFPGNKDVALTIKTRGRKDSGRKTWLLNQAGQDRRINIIDETLSRKAVDELLARSDVFLSLHRSEGFGLGCAEALAQGKIVVCTDYGGTTDFMSEDTGFPVAWRQVPVGEGEYVDAHGATWAEPEIEHAAECLKQIYDSPDDARRRALAGVDILRKNHDPKVIGERLAEMLTTRDLI